MGRKPFFGKAMTPAERVALSRARRAVREMNSQMKQETNMGEHFNRPPAKPLPSTVAEMLAGLKVHAVQSLNTHVNEIHIALWGDEDVGERYRSLIQPIWNEESAEGSLIADDFAMAAMIREYAAKVGDGFVAGTKLAAIRKSQKVVLRRYGLDRNQRRGEVMPNDDDQGDMLREERENGNGDE